MLNKVPEVTLYFWIIKIMCTTVGETAADYLNDSLGFGLTNTTYVTGALLGVSLTVTTPIFAGILAVVFAVWYAFERTLSIHTIVTTRREAFYWLAILFTFALGTAAGDLLAEKADLGYAVSIGIFGGAIALVALAHYALKMNAILSFWLAYILTRPLGASIGDEMSQRDHKYGGLGLGTTGTSYIFLGCILALVAYLTITKRDRTPAEVSDSGAEGRERRTPHHRREPGLRPAPQEG